ncbi:MAG: Efflux ABC transporter, ATP-binding protein [Cytophagales bacterium]|jgi:ABC-2 type transport system ATP-binding protein|nr:ABC transporter ATP-binding protein [Bacteroidota bacterium]MBS1982074.1 ABC transporter ATP-binding protein [Bacteroidota bacterium]WHZ06455.1 MAG: Efflux ABC transporter, ATP-binding protein [Cytophagales bacterium]
MIRVSNLKKKYDAVEALKGISFSIAEGEFYGLLGPNGAGKSTTISILSTILEPTEGEVSIAGYDLKQNPVECKKTIGVVPQEIALYNEMSAYDNLLFWGSLYGVGKAELQKRIDEILPMFGLYDRRNDKVKTYSGGMKRRINIASALLHQPRVLFMDEPTVGIDPQSRNLIFEVVEKLHRNGMTIVYTTHYMEEAERFCDRIGIIDNGQIIAQGTLDELRKSSMIKETIVIGFTNLTDELFEKIKTAWHDVKRMDQVVHFFSPNSKNDLSKIILNCNEAGLDVAHIEIQKINLETIFLNLTGKQLRD